MIQEFVVGSSDIMKTHGSIILHDSLFISAARLPLDDHPITPRQDVEHPASEQLNFAQPKHHCSAERIGRQKLPEQAEKDTSSDLAKGELMSTRQQETCTGVSSHTLLRLWDR